MTLFLRYAEKMMVWLISEILLCHILAFLVARLCAKHYSSTQLQCSGVICDCEHGTRHFLKSLIFQNFLGTRLLLGPLTFGTQKKEAHKTPVNFNLQGPVFNRHFGAERCRKETKKIPTTVLTTTEINLQVPQGTYLHFSCA